MSRPEAVRRLPPWLLLSAFCLTLSALALRDRLDLPRHFAAGEPITAEAPALPPPVVIALR